MNTAKRVVFGAIFAVFFMMFGVFVYGNIIIPWPYRHELKACLETARALPTQEEIDFEENKCFRTIPHFN